MNSFIENVNYVAGLDNLYGSEIELYKNNLSLKSVQHDIELKFSYYNNDDKKIHSIVHSEPGVLVSEINDTLLSFKTLVESSITGSEFTCAVSFMINNIVMVNISIVSNSDMYKAYELEMKVVTAGAVTYDVFGEVKDSLKILPSLAMITSSDIDAIVNVYEIQEDVITVSESITDVETVSDSIANVNTVAISIDNLNIVGEDIDNVNTVSTHISNVDTVSQSITNVNTVSSNIVDIGIASANISNINTVANAQNLADIIRVADDLNSLDVNGIADITIVANDLVLGVNSNTITVSESIDNVNITGNNIGNVNTVGINITDIGTVSTNIANVNITATDISSVNNVSLNIADVNTVSDGIINVNTVSGSISNVNTVSTNIVGLNSIVSNMTEILLADDNAAIATTKALESSDSAESSLQSAADAAVSAASALSNATIATTKASEALASATSAATSATNASMSETQSATSAGQSATSASSAASSATNANTSAIIASTQAGIAATKASEALVSANSAIVSKNDASSSATIALNSSSNAGISEVNAAISATSASASASTASAKASEASTSAANALASENKAKKWAGESVDVPVESGLYSAKHWAAKAAEIVGGGLIDDVSPSTSTVFSSTRSNNTYEPKNSNIQGHISNNTTNPHNVTKSQVGLSDVDNTSDVNKPISTATTTALAGKQDTLVSGTNIKTVNSSSILGSGDLSTIQTTITGNSGTATKLQTARTINGVAFDGSTNITIVDSTKLPLSGGTMTGAITAIRETKVAMAANNINLATGNLFTKTISGVTTLTISNALADGNVNSFVLELTNGGSAVVTWFSGVKWAGGIAPTLTTSGKDILGFYSHDGGTTWNILGVNKDVK